MYKVLLILAAVALTACTQRGGMAVVGPVASAEEKIIPLVDVIQYEGQYIETEKLVLVYEPMGCPEEHWHPLQRTVTTTAGVVITEPAEACGLGTISQRPIIQIEKTW